MGRPDRFAVCLLVSVAAGQCVFAQRSGSDVGQGIPVVRARGEAVLEAAPDQARLRFAVSNKAAAAQDAANRNAQQTNAVLSRLKQLLGSGGEIQTSDYTVAPDYRYLPNSEPTITGYTATNGIELTVRDLSLLPKLIDGAMSAGATGVNRIEFLLRDDGDLRAKTLAEATRRAKANAEAMAAALQLHVVRVLEVQSSDATAIRPLRYREQPVAIARAAEASTPIEAGRIEMRVSAEVTLQVSP